MKEIIKAISDFLSTNYWISLVEFAVILVLVVILIVVSIKANKKNKALNMSLIKLRKELLALQSSYDSAMDDMNENKLTIERALKDSISERDELIRNLDEEKDKCNNLLEENKKLEIKVDSILKVIELKKEQKAVEEISEINKANLEKLAELKSKKRRELFKLAHECGFHDFAQWKNEKLVDEIYKSKYLNNGGKENV